MVGSAHKHRRYRPSIRSLIETVITRSIPTGATEVLLIPVRPGIVATSVAGGT